MVVCGLMRCAVLCGVWRMAVFFDIDEAFWRFVTACRLDIFFAGARDM